MFIVFNKQKLYSYLVALSTVVILFAVAFVQTNKTEEILQTSGNVQALNGEVTSQTNSQINNEINNNVNNKTSSTSANTYINALVEN